MESPGRRTFFWRDFFYRELRAFPVMSAYIRVSACMPVMGKMADSGLLRKPDCVGGVISPVLANLFMHYAFDLWLEREFPAVEFERYADDGVPRTLREVAV